MAQGKGRKLGVIVLHGMGSQTEGFHAPLKRAVNGRLRDMGLRDNDSVIWQQVHWADVTEPNQRSMLRKYRDADLSTDWIREFIFYYLGDVVSYLKGDRKGLAVYHRVHQCIHDGLNSLYARADKNLPVVVFAHSLGCYMISDYIYDRQKFPADQQPNDEFATNAVTAGKTLAGMVTFGCNLPILLLGQTRLEMIEFPGTGFLDAIEQLAGEQAFDKRRVLNKARWLNFYDRSDVLGYPLAPLSDEFAAVVEDVKITAGRLNLFTNSPASHALYWEDDELVKRSAKLIKGILDLY